ncbi:hypothetical protein Tco_0128179 [Tanacetum coccineum]
MLPITLTISGLPVRSLLFHCIDNHVCHASWIAVSSFTFVFDPSKGIGCYSSIDPLRVIQKSLIPLADLSVSPSSEIRDINSSNQTNLVCPTTSNGLVELQLNSLQAVPRTKFSKKQTDLAISTTEAKYVSAGKAFQLELWMKQALVDYGIRLDDIPMMRDNKGAIDLSKNPVQHSRTKHIEICHHFLRDNVQKGNISIKKVPSEDNITDILTKPIKRESFNYLRLGLE